MINEDKIRKACSSDRERGFRLLVDSFQEPIYNYIRRMVVSHEDAEDVRKKSSFVYSAIWISSGMKVR